MLPDIQPGNTKILYFFNCLLDGMHTRCSLKALASKPCSEATNMLYLEYFVIKSIMIGIALLSLLSFNVWIYSSRSS